MPSSLDRAHVQGNIVNQVAVLRRRLAELERTALLETTDGGGGGDADAEYLTLAYSGDLTAERLFTPGGHLSGSDGGAGAAYGLDVALAAAFAWTNIHTFSDYITVLGGIHVGGAGDPGNDNLVVDGYGNIDRLILGGVGDPGAWELNVNGQVWIVDFLAAGGGIHVGGDSDPGTDNLLVDGYAGITDYLYALGGVHVGGSGDPGADNLLVDGYANITGRITSGSYITAGSYIGCTDYLYAMGGIHVGGSADPGTDNLVVDGYGNIDRLRIGSTGDPGSWELYVSGEIYCSNYIRGDGGLTTCSTDPGTNRLYVGDFAKIMGGLHVGGTSDPGTDNLWVDGDCRFGSGVWIGAIGTNPDDNDLHIDGSINKSTALGCRAYRSTAQLIGTGSWTPLSWNVQVHDTDGCFSPTSSYMYARHAGYYMAGGCAKFAGSTTGYRMIAVYNNAGCRLAHHALGAADAATDALSISTGMFYMAVNAWVQIKVWHNHGSNLNVDAATSTDHKNSGWLARIA